MIDLSRVRNYYVACGYTDLRRGIDGLAAIVTMQYGMELREDSLFLFCGRRTDRIKALYWSGEGYVLIYKRLCNGSFQWPRSTEELKSLDAQSFRLLLNAQRAQFGQSSEKRSYVLADSEQMRIFNEAEQAQDAKAEESTERTLVAAHERKKKRTNKELAEGLPTKEIVLELPEEQMNCSVCGKKMVPIGKKFLYAELQVIPKQVFLIRYYTPYLCLQGM